MIARRSALAAPLLLALPARAQPAGNARPVTLVVPFAPGGPTDLIARRLALSLHPLLGETVLVENRAGAGGNVGAEAVARAAPDGRTVLFGTSGPLAINRALYPGQTYDPVKDFSPIAPLGRIPNVLAVNPNIQARDVQALIALDKGGERLSFGSSGNGASSHLAGALFNRMAGTHFEHVPYRGTGPALNDALAGHVAMVFTDVLTALPHVQEGRLRALGVTTLQRSPVLPDLPTIAEQGLPGYDASVFFGLVVPAATPAAARETLRAALASALAEPELRRTLEGQGMQIASAITPGALSALMAEETERWAVVIRDTGARAD
ncbi:tripartite tricarboxylate transporter substrate-binding protein [Roseomonas sp. NAR14]|uniref:Tripartite tricarboxylate transporter substrate-binding protein n=1 Tax=Roseomonas acroporae TaxID=2937791 RepID=A0A9X2BVB2_9PROT|nr:tripartite tricarboxylate transporter substrate-binding protein [Roseomonas acroporae]MCK8786507.1 tripartite tricarboxylate transporter substrate-binding protein [Roseomonas acroporae]